MTKKTRMIAQIWDAMFTKEHDAIMDRSENAVYEVLDMFKQRKNNHDKLNSKDAICFVDSTTPIDHDDVKRRKDRYGLY